MNRAILITRPDHDLVTKYLYVWTGLFIKIAKKKGVKYFDLSGKKAIRQKFESYLKKQKPSLLFLNGHGSREVITGHDDEILIDKDSSFRGGVTYARSCDAGQLLGRILVNSGLETFIGYKRKFILGYSPDKTTKPLQDNIAKLFLEPSNLVPSTLLKGHTSQNAYERSKQAMHKNFQKMISSVATFEERYAAKWLWSNMSCQVLLGNPHSKI